MKGVLNAFTDESNGDERGVLNAFTDESNGDERCLECLYTF